MSLPSGYKRLEYIESTGTQYIDLNIVPTNHTFEIQYDSGAYNNDEKLFGTEAGYMYYAFTLFSNKYYWGLNGSQTSGGAWSAGKKTLLYNSGPNYSVIQDGVTLGSGSVIAANGQSLCLFKRLKTEGVFFKGLTYYCKLTEKSTNKVVRDCIPVKRLSDGAVGLYDKVENKFHANAGTGTLIAGPVAAPEMPEGLSASVNGAFATLTWSASNDATGYKISRNGVQIADQTALSFTDTVEQGQTYVYTVVAYNDSGDSEPAQLTVQTPPGAPTTLSQTMAVRLAWAAVSSTERYNIYRNGRLLGTTTDLFFVDDTAAENTEYTYGVSAVNSGGESAKATITIYTKSGYFLYKPYIESATFQ